MAENTVERILRERATLPTVALVPKYRKQDVIELGGFNKYLKAAASSPEDWWHGIHFLNSLSGLYGERHQRKAKSDLQIMLMMLQTLAKSLPEIYKLLTAFLHFSVNHRAIAEAVINNVDPQVVADEIEDLLISVDKIALAKFLADAAIKIKARKVGKKFTVFAASGGAAGLRRLRGKKRKVIDVSNTTLIVIGSLWRYVIMTKGKSRTFLGPYFAFTSGDISYGIDARTEYRLRKLLENVDLKISSSVKSDINSSLKSVESTLHMVKIKMANP